MEKFSAFRTKRSISYSITYLLTHSFTHPFIHIKGVYELLQHFLYEPKLFHNGVQLIVPIPTSDQKYAVEQYWSLDDIVVKEVIVKKLKNKSRKDLDEVTHSLT